MPLTTWSAIKLFILNKGDKVTQIVKKNIALAITGVTIIAGIIANFTSIPENIIKIINIFPKKEESIIIYVWVKNFKKVPVEIETFCDYHIYEKTQSIPINDNPAGTIYLKPIKNHNADFKLDPGEEEIYISEFRDESKKYSEILERGGKRIVFTLQPIKGDNSIYFEIERFHKEALNNLHLSFGIGFKEEDTTEKLEN